MTAEQLTQIGLALEQEGERLVSAGHMLLVQAQAIQRQATHAPKAAKEAEEPLYPEGTT